MGMRPGQSFENADVVEYYQFRPEYPIDVFKKLIALSPRTANALDLGCGTGKIARGLSKSFESVTAVDASASMLRVAVEHQDRGVNNIAWVHGLAESTDFAGGPFDLVVAAASIHWMDQAVLFPRLFNNVSTKHVFAIVEGDEVHQASWSQAWDDFLTKWIFLIKGERYEPHQEDSDFRRYMTRYRDWIDVEGEIFVQHDVFQSVDHFVKCQHSRDTFAPSKMGAQISEFDDELFTILQPHAENEMITYTVQTRVEWGSIKYPCNAPEK